MVRYSDPPSGNYLAAAPAIRVDDDSDSEEEGYEDERKRNNTAPSLFPHMVNDTCIKVIHIHLDL